MGSKFLSKKLHNLWAPRFLRLSLSLTVCVAGRRGETSFSITQGVSYLSLFFFSVLAFYFLNFLHFLLKYS